jgi:hypothetical protein
MCCGIYTNSRTLLSTWAFGKMIQLPPGCKLAYEIRFYVPKLTNEMGEWFNLIGGQATSVKEYDWRGREHIINQVQYGKAKTSYVTKDGTNLTLIRFDGADASIASMFLIKFMDQIQSHNLKEAEDYV